MESVEDLNEEELNLIEDKLLTSNGRRNNVSYFDFCKFVNKKKVEDLVCKKSCYEHSIMEMTSVWRLSTIFYVQL